MSFPSRLVFFILFTSLTMLLTSCNNGSPASSMTTTAVLKGSGLDRGRVRSAFEAVGKMAWLPSTGPRIGRVAATLTNITGKADSLVILTTEDACAFVVWAADSQRGAVATEGRTVEDFNLGNPADWTSTGSGIRDICSGGTMTGIEAYFAYMDLAFTVASTNFTVRIAMGEYGSYQPGDVLVSVAGTFNWIDSVGTTLTPETSTRPTSPYQYAAISDFTPFVDGGNTAQTVLEKVSMSVDTASQAITLNQSIAKAVVDVDFSTASLDVTTTTSAATVAKTLSVQFLNDFSNLVASVTALTQAEVGTSTDPEPTIGNGE